MTQTKQERLEKKRAWERRNADKVKAYAKKTRQKHKEKRLIDHKLWVEKNKEHVKEYQRKYQKEWYKRNKAKKNAQSTNWAKENPDKIMEYKAKFAKSNPEKTKDYLKKYELTIKGKYRSLKGSATRRNYDVDISLEEYTEITSKECLYCGEKDKHIGVDRIDNTKGYTLENSAPCCTICNMMKKAMSIPDFLSHVSKIHNHNNLLE